MITQPELAGVVLVTSELAAQRAFYRDVLGLPLRADYGSAAFFEAGATRLALFARGHHPEADERLRDASKGIGHLEFAIAEAAYPELRDQLTEAGHRAYRENFQDADGNLFHFVPGGKHTW